MDQAVAFPVGKELEITSRAMKALSNPVRLQIVKYLSTEELSVTELTDRITTHSQSSISQHLAFLFKNGIISNRRQGTLHFYKIADRRTDILIRMIMETFCPKSGSRAAGALSAA
jgi:ArsR family transcriptional regulator